MIKLGTNIQSQTVQRYLGNATQELSRASERLASGQRINKASDDAAGLAISTSLDKDKLLTQTTRRNVSDGISMVNILSSGLSSQKEILYRMAELAEQSSNGTYTSTQRTALQKEYSSLMDEFDRIADTTEFNGVKLLRNPTPQTIGIMAGITGGGDSSLLTIAAANSHRYAGVLAQRSNWNGDGRVNATDIGAERSYYKQFLPGFSDVSTDTIKDRAFEPTLLTATRSDGQTVNIALILSRVRYSQMTGGGVYTDPPTARGYHVAAVSSDGEVVLNETGSVTYNPDSTKLDISLTFATSGTTLSFGIDISGLTYQSRDPIGVNSLTLPPDAVTRQTAIGFTNVLSSYSSRRALDTVLNRIEDVSALEGQYGALVSRLSVAHNILGAAGENFAAASSRIKDADIAAESSVAIRSGILQQTASAVLAQANQAPQVALSLLRNI